MLDFNMDYSPTAIARWAAWLVDLTQSFSVILIAIIGIVLTHTKGVSNPTVLGYIAGILTGIALFLFVLRKGQAGDLPDRSIVLGLPLVVFVTVVVNLTAGSIAAFY